MAAAVEMAAAVDAHVVDVADKSLFRTLGIECSGIEMMRYKNCFCKNLYIKTNCRQKLVGLSYSRNTIFLQLLRFESQIVGSIVQAVASESVSLHLLSSSSSSFYLFDLSSMCYPSRSLYSSVNCQWESKTLL